MLVGPAEKSYSLHKGLLCKYSDYFRAALTGSFAEAATQTVRLDEEDPAIFDLFVTWLYTQRIIPEDMTSKDVDWKILAEQYVFADRRSSPSFKNAIIDALATKALDKEQFLPQYGTIKWIWDNTADKASLRRFMVDYFAHVADLDEAFRTQRDRKRPPLDFVCDVLGEYYRLTKRMCSVNWEFEKPDIGKNYHDKIDK